MDISIALAYYKCMDDWKDEKQYLKRLYAESIKKQYQEVAEKYPRQCKAISESIRELEQIENSTADAKPDEASWTHPWIIRRTSGNIIIIH